MTIDTNEYSMYECTGEPIRDVLNAWIEGVKDPATDPKWRRKDRMKRIFRKIMRIIKWAGIATVILGVTWNIVKRHN